MSSKRSLCGRQTVGIIASKRVLQAAVRDTVPRARDAWRVAGAEIEQRASKRRKGMHSAAVSYQKCLYFMDPI